MDKGFRLGEKDCYRLFHTGILVCIALFGTGGLLGIGSWNALHFLAAICAAALFAGMQAFTIKGRILCLVSTILFLFITGMAVGIQTSVSFFYSYYQWITGSDLWMEEWVIGYELLQTVFVTMFCYFLEVILEKYAFLKIGISGLLLFHLLFHLFAEKDLSHAGVVFTLCYAVMTGVEWIQIHWRKIRSREVRAYMLWIMPFMAVYLLCMLLMPVPEKPYDWQFVKNTYHQIKESFLILTQNMMRGGEEDFDMAFSGFSGNGEMFGNVRKDDREIMTVQGQNSLVTNVYLTGKIYDTFDGRQWKQENHDASPERLLDTAETLYAVQRFDEQYLRDYLYNTTLHIQYRYFNTAFLFAPLKTERIGGTGGTQPFMWEGGSLLFYDKKGYGMEYDAAYYQLNVDSEEFYRLLETVQVPDETVLEEILKNCGERGGVELTLEDMDDHIRRIYDVYLDEAELLDETEEYLDRITEGAETDVEKLRLIEKELSSFTYTRTPGKLPDNLSGPGEFLDYFLQESRQGYCTYFATAFVLLARAEGIPARYVEGFLVPVNGNKETLVYSDMAHAWPEVYIEGVGWIPFEPTPGYAQMRYTPWKTRQSGVDGIPDREESARTVPAKEAESASRETDAEEKEGKGYGGIFGRAAAYAVLTVLAVCLIVLVLDSAIGKYRYRRMNALERFRVEINENMKILSWLGLRRSDGETLHEFKNRAQLMPELEDQTLKFIEDYEEILYGGKEMEQEMAAGAKKEGRLLLEVLKEKKKRMYFYYRLRLFMRTFMYK